MSNRKKKKDTNVSSATHAAASSSQGKLALIFDHSVLLTRMLHIKVKMSASDIREITDASVCVCV